MAFGDHHTVASSATVHATALRSFTRRLVGASDHDAILQTVLTNSPDGHRPAPALLAVRERNGDVRLAARSDVPAEVDLPAHVPDDASIPLVHVMRERAPLWIECEAERDRWFPELRVIGRNPSAGAILPLEVGDDLVGAIGLCFWYEHKFSERERQLYQLLADLCALAVERLEHQRHPHLN